MKISETTNGRTIPTRENRNMNMLNNLFGRRARAAGESTAETADTGEFEIDMVVVGLPEDALSGTFRVKLVVP